VWIRASKCFQFSSQSGFAKQANNLFASVVLVSKVFPGLILLSLFGVSTSHCSISTCHTKSCSLLSIQMAVLHQKSYKAWTIKLVARIHSIGHWYVYMQNRSFTTTKCILVHSPSAFSEFGVNSVVSLNKT